MELRPITKYTTPAYPTRDILNAQPELLRLLPHRWREHAIVLGTLLAVGSLTTLRWSPALAEGKPAEPKQPVSRIAPLFPEGAEKRAYGLRGEMPPPVYLTEADARQLILDETKKAGLNFEMDKLTLKDIPVVNKATENKDQQKLTVTLDGTDKKLGVSFEYVSHTDFDEWNKAKNFSFDELSTAKVLRDSLEAAKPAGTYAVFYDCESGDTKYTKEQLQKQVQEFIAWLKAQKVI